jgi:hypothetical protein
MRARSYRAGTMARSARFGRAGSSPAVAMLEAGGMDAGREAAPEMLEAAVSMTRSELMRAREEKSGGRGGECAARWRRAPLGAQARKRGGEVRA